jgi:hypothetical protein
MMPPGRMPWKAYIERLHISFPISFSSVGIKAFESMVII